MNLFRKFYLFDIVILALAIVCLQCRAFTICSRKAYGFQLLSTSGKGFGKKTSNIVNNDDKSSDKQTIDLSQSTNINTMNPQFDSTLINNTDAALRNTGFFQTSKQREEEEMRQKIRELQEEEALIASDPSVGAVPQLVADRMIGRIAGFFGIPVFGGLAIFVGAFFASRYYDFTLPPNLIAYATQVPFVIGLLGISYAILSSSWDEEPGSFWGIDEFKINVKRVQDGFARQKRTATLKEEIEKTKRKY